MLMLLLAAFLVLLNGFFVAAEFALVKVRATQLDALIDEGPAGVKPHARMARHILRHLDPYLSATQLGITLASLGLGWVGEPAVAHLIEPLLAWAGVTDPKTMHSISLVVAFTFISFLHIVVGEIAPKSMAIAAAPSVSVFVAWPMRVFYVIFYPAMWVLNGASNALLRWFGIQPIGGGHGSAVTAEELYHIAEQSAETGAITAGEGRLLTNVLSFSDHVAREIMTPRGRVIFLTTDLSLDEALQVTQQSGFTRLPLIDDSPDEPIGIVHLRDLLPYLSRQIPFPGLAPLARRALYVPENMPAQKLLVEFQKRRMHFAFVVDEFGGLSGIVTLEDALEELVGEIHDEFDIVAQPIIRTDTGFAVDGGVLLQDLLPLLELDELESEADTVGGYLMERLSRVPQVGDTVEVPGWILRVRSMDRLRIGRVEAIINPVMDTT